MLDGSGAGSDGGCDDEGVNEVISWLSLAVIIIAIIIICISIVIIEAHSRKKARERFKKAGSGNKLSRQDILAGKSQ